MTSASAILVCIFAGFFAVGSRNSQEFALGLAVAVLVDATLVRSLLLPSTMKLLGDWNWWLPPFLRWIPQMRIEGGPGEAPTLWTARAPVARMTMPRPRRTSVAGWQ